MMALVPSNTSNNDEIHEEFRTIKSFVLNQDQDNQSEASHLHANERTANVLNNKYSHQIETDDTMIEQLYQFQQYRIGLSNPSNTNTIRQKQMPVISIATAYDHYQRQSMNDSLGIQLPLIETNRPRSSNKLSGPRQSNEPLDVLPLKHRRNPMSLPLAQISDDVNFTERRIIYVANERPPTPKTSESSLRFRSLSREEPSVSSIPLTHRLQKGILSRPFLTPEFDSDRQNIFRLIIQNGQTKDQTDEFLHYRQSYYPIWGNIVKIFRLLEKLMKDYLIPFALINGERVAELAQTIELEHEPSLEELLSTIINRDEIEKLIKQPDRRFFGNHGKGRAAIIIQSNWRGFHVRRIYKNIRQRQQAVHIIISAWLKYSKTRKLRDQLHLSRVRQLEFFHKKQKEFRDQWKQISSNRRVIIHLASLGLTKRIRRKFKDLSIRQNCQIGCLCELEDPNVDMIYVASMPINDEIMQYYNKLINLRASVEQGNEQAMIANKANEKFTIIVPEFLNRFPGHHMCLATLLKYSPKALKQIQTLIQNRSAYMVTGISHLDDLYLSEYLNIPIYGCEPEVSYLYSTKSGSKRIFNSSQVPIPYGVYDIYDQKHLLESLAQLIVDYPDIQRWIFKIDDHFDGLGIAYCDIRMYLSSFENLSKDLPEILEKHTIFVNKTQFHSWSSYLKVFLSQGGIIEAYPPSNRISTITVSLSIDPNGQYNLLCSGDQIHSESEFSTWGLSFPQITMDSSQLNTYCSLIIEQCKQREIFGYIDIDFLVFRNNQTNKQEIWISDLSIGYSEHVALFRVMKYITTGEFHPQTHSFIVKKKQIKQKLRNWQNGAPEYIITENKRFAIWSTKLYHENFVHMHYSNFFQICRSHGIGFDIREKQGSIFTLLEGDQHQHLGMITIGESLQTTLTNFLCYLNAIYHEISEGQNNFLSAGNHIQNLIDNFSQKIPSTSQ